jgi:transposase
LAADDDDHQCRWRDEAEQLRAEMEELRQKFASLERRVLGPKSEKMPSMAGEVRKERPASAEDAKQLRAENLRARKKVPTEIVPVPVPAADRTCPSCGNDELKRVGNGTPSETYVYIASHFRRRVYQRETLSCSCGKHIVTAPCPDKLADRSPYTASFIAALIVHKCEDGIPI